jgi:hypothetical protein
MQNIQKTVFLSYRRTNFPWALSIFQNLTQHGYDVFFDFTGIASGDFERVILESIKARAHFLVLLTPSALGRCVEPGDWLRREIETALAIRRNIVPLMLEGFDFSTPVIASQLKGALEPLQHYNALQVPAAYFAEAMQRLREKYLNIPLDAVLHPPSLFAQQSAKDQQAAASNAPSVRQRGLSEQEWLEQGVKAEGIREDAQAMSWYRKAADAARGMATFGLKYERLRSLPQAFREHNVLVLGSSNTGKTALLCYMEKGRPLKTTSGGDNYGPDRTTGAVIVGKSFLINKDKWASVANDVSAEKPALWQTVMEEVRPSGIIYMVDPLNGGKSVGLDVLTANVDREIDHMLNRVFNVCKGSSITLRAFHVFLNFSDVWNEDGNLGDTLWLHSVSVLKDRVKQYGGFEGTTELRII